MPVFRSGAGRAPGWCELTAFEVVALGPGDRRRFEREASRERVVVGSGTVRFGGAGPEEVAATGAVVDRPPGDVWEVEAIEPATLVRLGGRWGDETGGCGLFSVRPSTAPADHGDPVPYGKETDFDSHFHDCDEYWIVLEGRGVAVSEGLPYEVGPGDCVATGMGHHHDFPKVDRPVRAVYFETTLGGAKRRGHLWEHTHGPAAPRRDRI